MCTRVLGAAALYSILLVGCAFRFIGIDPVVDAVSYDAPITGFLSKPDGAGPFPAVVLMHGCSGLTAGVRQGLDVHASYLVSRGFVTLILDSFSARGKYDEAVCSKESELSAARHYRQYDAFHALNFLQSQPFVDANNIFLMGQSNGGSVALSVAAGADVDAFPSRPRFQAIVAYYPWCAGALPRKIVSPLLVFGAGNDDWVRPEACVDAKPDVTGAPYEVIVYDDVYHSFDLPIPIHNYVGHVVGGDPAATKDSQTRMADWFLMHRQ